MATIFAISLSIDALGVGLFCGIRKIKLGVSTYLILAIFSMVIMGLSMFFGGLLFEFLSDNIVDIIGGIGQILLGVWILFQVNKGVDMPQKTGILRAFSLSFLLSVDSMGAGIVASALGLNMLYLPILVAATQIGFLAAGCAMAKVLARFGKATKILAVLPGISFIVLGIIGLA